MSEAERRIAHVLSLEPGRDREIATSGLLTWAEAQQDAFAIAMANALLGADSHAWLAITACAEKLDEAQLQRLDDALSGWDAQRREAPMRWVKESPRTPLSISPALRIARRIDLRGANLDNAGLTALVQHPASRNLTHLDLAHNHIQAEGARALADSPHMRALTHLSLAYNSLFDDGAFALAHSENLGALESLDLSNAWIGDEGVQAIADSTTLNALFQLNLSGNDLTDDAQPALDHLMDTLGVEVEGVYDSDHE